MKIKAILPAISLKQHHKFILIAALYLIPTAGISIYVNVNKSRKISDLHNERRGVEYIDGLRLLLENVQTHRGVVNAALLGDPDYSAMRDRARKSVDKTMWLLAKKDRAYRHVFKSSASYVNIVTQWRNIKNIPPGISASKVFAAHNELNADIIDLVHSVAATSGLVYNTATDREAMIDLMVGKLMILPEYIGQLRGYSLGALVSGDISKTERFEIQRLMGAIGPMLDSLEYSRNEFRRGAGYPSAVTDMIAELKTFLELMRRKLIESPTPAITRRDYYKAASIIMRADYMLYDQVSDELKWLLKKSVNKERAEAAGFNAVTVFIFGVFAYTFIRFKNSLAKQTEYEEKICIRSITTC